MYVKLISWMNLKSPASKKGYYDPVLDGMRGLFILPIVYHHAVGDAFNEQIYRDYVFSFSYLLLNLFFTLSAYTLLKSTQVKFFQEKTPIRNFYIRRFFRIIPLWWVVITVLFLTRDIAVEHYISNVFLYFGFMQFIPDYNFTTVGWSLFVEETFYVFFPLMLGWLLVKKNSLWFVAYTTIVFIVWHGLARNGYITNENHFDVRFPLGNYVSFATGILAFHVLHDEEWKRFLVKYKALLGFAFLLSYWGFRSNFFFVPGILFFLYCKADGSWLNRMFHGRHFGFIRTLGVMAFSIYLLQIFTVTYVNSWLESLGIVSSSNEIIDILTIFLANVFALFILGAISFRFLELPFINIGKGIIRKSEKGAVESSN